MDSLKQTDCCCEPVNSVSEAISDPQVQSRDMVLETLHPVAGPLKQIGMPVKFSDTPGSIRRHAPAHGEHTAEILRGLGYDEKDLKEMEREGVIRI